MAKYDIKYTTGSAPTGTTKYDNLAFATGSPDYTQPGWTGGVDDTIYSGGSFQFNGTLNAGLDSVQDVSAAGNFTIELWVYPTSTEYFNFFQIGNNEPYQTRFFIDNGVVGFYKNQEEYIPDTILTSAGSITQNTWQHVAVVRSGTTITAYINGVAGSSPATGISGAIGNVHGWSAVMNTYATCYITNFRWNNTTAVYTGAFTPSTMPLTPTQKSGVNISRISSGTKILLLASSSSELISHPIDGNFISDSSGNNYTIRNSWIIPINDYVTPRVTYSSLSPFTPSTPRYLFIGNSTDLSLTGRSAGAGSTTIETNRPIHWATNNKSDAEVLRVINRLPQRPQNYTDAAAALAWIGSSSYYTVVPL